MNISRLSRLTFALVLATSLTSKGQVTGTPAKNSTGDVLLSAMEQELQRAQSALGKLDPAPYFISYSARDQNLTAIVASQGALLSAAHLRRRSADVTMRIGTPALDNTHGQNRPSAITSGTLPLDDDRDAIAHELWRLTYEEYRKASQAFLNVKTGTEVQAKEEDTSPDFSREKVQPRNERAADSAASETKAPGDKPLEKMVRDYSAYFRKFPYIYNSAVLIDARQSRQHFASSEGTRIVAPSDIVRLAIEAETLAPDGMELLRVETFQADRVDRLPPASEIEARLQKMAADLKALQAAPLAEPYNGPALLSGRAAGVFFHEVLGHRLEGHRQRGEQEGQTFTKKVGQLILPEFLSVSDDPTVHNKYGTDLSGWYEYDDEGVPATRVDVVRNGVLQNFLMSRMPIKGFDSSNGHGRSQAGLVPTGRQGNLIVSSSHTVPDSQLRKLLLDEVRKQGKSYGLYFEDIQGGFTLTQRGAPQSFQVLPVLVWRVYPDGRPDELVRGVDIVGTPLAALNRIQVTGDTPAVFNGMCGAESGQVPVAAIAPAILFSELEVQKRAHALNRQPILPPPGESQAASGKGAPQ